MKQLHGLDASFLYLETPAQLMHVCGLFVLDTETMPEEYSFKNMPLYVCEKYGLPLAPGGTFSPTQSKRN